MTDETPVDAQLEAEVKLVVDLLEAARAVGTCWRQMRHDQEAVRLEAPGLADLLDTLVEVQPAAMTEKTTCSVCFGTRDKPGLVIGRPPGVKVTDSHRCWDTFHSRES